jgi:hypothetical protein
LGTKPELAAPLVDPGSRASRSAAAPPARMHPPCRSSDPGSCELPSRPAPPRAARAPRTATPPASLPRGTRVGSAGSPSDRRSPPR